MAPSLWLTHHCNRGRRGRKRPSRDIPLVLDKDPQSRSSLHSGSARCLIVHRESSVSPLYCVISICCFFGRYAAGSIRGWIGKGRERRKGRREVYACICFMRIDVCMYVRVCCDVGAPATVAFWCHAQGERERARSGAHTISRRA